MSWTHCAWASKQVAGSPINKLTLMMMADATSHDNPLLILRIKTLAAKCESSESSVKRAIKDLEDAGLLICVERFFEGNQQSNAYILMTDEIRPEDAFSIAKENERSGCFFRIREPSGSSLNPGVGSQGTQGGFTVTPRATPSSSYPSSSQPIYVDHAEATEQQPEKADSEAVTQHLSDVAPALRSEVTVAPAKKSSIPASQIEAIYSAYPTKVGRGVALKSIEKAIKDFGYDPLLEATQAYARATETWGSDSRKWIPNPSTWFNQQRYMDDRSAWTKNSTKTAAIRERKPLDLGY